MPKLLMDCSRIVTKLSKPVVGRKYSFAMIQSVSGTADFGGFVKSVKTVVKAVKLSLIIRLAAMFSDVFIVLIVGMSSSIKGAEITQM